MRFRFFRLMGLSCSGAVTGAYGFLREGQALEVLAEGCKGLGAIKDAERCLLLGLWELGGLGFRV